MARISEEPSRTYDRFRRQFSGLKKRSRKKPGESEAFSSGRDPLPVSAVFAEVRESFGWEAPLAEAEFFVRWPEIVGEGVAENVSPVSLIEGKLTIQASSSAWATQMRLIRHELLTTFAEKAPEVPINAITVLAPGAPSWKKGSRSVSGRGPRDTYG